MFWTLVFVTCLKADPKVCTKFEVPYDLQVDTEAQCEDIGHKWLAKAFHRNNKRYALHEWGCKQLRSTRKSA